MKILICLQQFFNICRDSRHRWWGYSIWYWTTKYHDCK